MSIRWRPGHRVMRRLAALAIAAVAVTAGPIHASAALADDDQTDCFPFDAGTGWNSWTAIPGTLITRITAVPLDKDRMMAFGVGTDRVAYYNIFDGINWGATDWNGWKPVADGFTVGPGSSISATARNGKVDIIVLGNDGLNTPYTNTWNGSSWNGWMGMGGAMATSEPSLASPTPYQTVAFGRGTDSRLYYNVLNTLADGNGGHWSGWALAPNSPTFATDPVATSGYYRADVVAIDGAGATYHNDYYGSAWDSWHALGGRAYGRPAVADAAGAVDVVVRGDGNVPYVNKFSGSTWSGWQNMGGTITSDPVAHTTAGDTTYVNSAGATFVVARDSGNGLQVNAIDDTVAGANWEGWKSIAGTNVNSTMPDITSHADDFGEVFGIDSAGTPYHRVVW